MALVAPGASGNILTSNGSSWVSTAPPAVVPGVTSVNGSTGGITAAQIAAAAAAGWGYTPPNPAAVAPASHSHSYAPMTAVVSIVKYEDSTNRYIRYTRANGAVVDVQWVNISDSGGGGE